MKLRHAGALLLAGVTLAACGTRLPDSAFTAGTTERVASAAGGKADTAGGPSGSAGGTTATTFAGLSGSGSPGGGGLAGGGSTATTIRAGPNRASDVGVTETTITIGTIAAENGVLGDTFAPSARGMRAWAAAINAKGGINGRKVVLKTCDDREDRTRTLACAQQLVENDKIFAIAGANSRVLGGAADYLDKKAVPVLGTPITNAFYRYPHFWSSYAFGFARDGKTVGYKGQVMYDSANARWFKQELGVTNAAMFMYDINESKQAGDAFAKGLELEGIKVTKYLVSFAAPSFDQAVADMARQGTTAIFDSMDDGANRKLCDAMARRKFSVKAKVSTVVSMGDAVGTTYNDTCRNSVYIPGETIPYTNTAVPEVAAFRAAYKKYQPGQPLHQWALEAWGLGQMLAEGVRLQGPAPTRVGLENYLRGLDKYSGGGLFLGLDWRLIDYSKPRTASCITIARWLDSEGGWVSATNKFPFCYPDVHQYGSPALDQGN